MKQILQRRSKGFSILAVILVIVAVMGAAAAWVLSGKANTTNPKNNLLDIQASAILTDSASIKATYDNLILNGVLPSSIVFVPDTPSTSTTFNILDPNTGIQVPKVNPNSVRASPASSQGFWVFNQAGIYGKDVGTNGGRDPAVLITGLKPDVCKRINYMLYGSTTMIQLAYASTNWLTAGASPANPSSGASVDLTSGTFSAVSGWTAGCVDITGGSGDDTAFFRILKAT